MPLIKLNIAKFLTVFYMIYIFLIIILIVIIYLIYRTNRNNVTTNATTNGIPNYQQQNNNNYDNSYNNSYGNDYENFGNIGTPYYDGLSDAQTGWDMSRNEQLLMPINSPINVRMPQQGKKKCKASKTSKKMPMNEIYNNEIKLNGGFIEGQFNDSYRDVMTAIIQMAPEMKSVFNLQVLPVTTTDYDPKKQMPSDIIKLIYQFIKQLNTLLETMPDSAEIISDYNNYLPLTSQQNNYIKNKGINEFYNSIGVNFNLYAETPPSSIVQFVKVISARREYTDEDTRYIVTFVVKKILKSVSDQMQITVYFIIKNQPTQFTNINTSTSPEGKQIQQVILEYVYTDGFWTNAYDTTLDCYGGTGKKESSSDVNDDNYYNFNALKTTGITNDALIIKETNKKLRERELARNNFTQNLAYPIYENDNLTLQTDSIYPH